MDINIILFCGTIKNVISKFKIKKLGSIKKKSYVIKYKYRTSWVNNIIYRNSQVNDVFLLLLLLLHGFLYINIILRNIIILV